MVRLAFKSGTLEIHGLPEGHPAVPSSCRWDARTGCHRAPAMAYAPTVLALKAAKIEFEDEARRYQEIDATPAIFREPRPYQREALEAWKRARGRGVVVLPTGAGKTHVAVMAIELWKRSTLIVAPTLDLVRQWYDLLRATFDREIGVIGGGEHDVQPITVTTYDSAYLHVEHLGDRFGMVVFDECHHLPGATYALAAQLSIAPFRLGLTATPERSDGREALTDELIGPVVYRKDIVELSGEFLAEYDVVRVPVHLTPEEREEYEAERGIYRAFVARSGIRMSQPDGWSKFIMLSTRSAEGRRAMQGYRRQRELAHTAPAKLEWVERLLHVHRNDRAILFTQDNATCYALSRRFLIPAITHQTKVKERSAILAGLSAGTYAAVSTSKVLNEGVDVPDANVAIVVSGSGSVREHVQRLGRVLRKREGKLATLYELVTVDTGETYTSERRREHSAYR
ncbi:MAG: DEAD/DEAH box helicase family protein [Myxococcota bacterium]|nr:DEAD/DEAH box helicase family protein [Myxococcota bacterium]